MIGAREEKSIMSYSCWVKKTLKTHALLSPALFLCTSKKLVQEAARLFVVYQELNGEEVKRLCCVCSIFPDYL